MSLYPPYIGYLDSERAAWAFVLIPHFVRLVPKKTITDYVKMAMFATTPKTCQGLLNPVEQQLLLSAKGAAGMRSMPRDLPLRPWLVVDLLERNGLQIDPQTLTCSLPEDFNLRDVPEIDVISRYAAQMLAEVSS